MSKLKSVNIYKKTIKLNNPYKLSFVCIDEIVSTIVEIELNNYASGLSESVALPGYNQETSDQLHDRIMRLASYINKMEADEADKTIKENYKIGSFATSALLSALELAKGIFIPPRKIKIPLLAPISTDNPKLMMQKCENIYQSGYKTIKVKIGNNIENDIIGARTLLNFSFSDLNFRFDANQAYDFDQAKYFIKNVSKLNSDKIELLEQPLQISEWGQFSKLCELSKIPLMLDESIYTLSDVQRAAKVGAKYIKLKLFKHCGINDLITLAKEAYSLGLGVVLGNGVSSDIGNLIESWIFGAFPNLFHGAFEGNGFVKLTNKLLNYPPQCYQGYLTWNKPNKSFNRILSLS